MFNIRQATIDDCLTIRQMAQEVFPKTYQEILTPEQIKFMMEWMYSIPSLQRQMTEEGHIYFIAYEECEAAGYVSIQPEGPDLFHLQKIYVLPYFQGHHLGAQLFNHAIKAVKALHPGSCRMELNVNRHNKALHFYEKMGMTKLREGDFDIGGGYFMNDYIMGMDL